MIDITELLKMITSAVMLTILIFLTKNEIQQIRKQSHIEAEPQEETVKITIFGEEVE